MQMAMMIMVVIVMMTDDDKNSQKQFKVRQRKYQMGLCFVIISLCIHKEMITKNNSIWHLLW